jgi:pimeloyl-ACP methyl ester carboxylesterase
VLTPPATVRRIAGRFSGPQATFLELPDMGHWLVAEPGWERVAGLCLDWLESAGFGRGRKNLAAIRRGGAEARL